MLDQDNCGRALHGPARTLSTCYDARVIETALSGQSASSAWMPWNVMRNHAQDQSCISRRIFGSGLKRDPRLGAARQQEVQARALHRPSSDVTFVFGLSQPGCVASAYLLGSLYCLNMRPALGLWLLPRPCGSLTNDNANRYTDHCIISIRAKDLYRAWSAMRLLILLRLSAHRNHPGQYYRRLMGRWWLSGSDRDVYRARW